MMTTERLNEIKQWQQEWKGSRLSGRSFTAVEELVAEVEWLRGFVLRDGRRVAKAAEQGAKGLKEPDGVKCTGG